MKKIMNILSDTRIVISIVGITFVSSVFVGYKVREYQIQKAHELYKQQRVEAYMEYQALLEKYMNMAKDIEADRDL